VVVAKDQLVPMAAQVEVPAEQVVFIMAVLDYSLPWAD
jgi:hypothetical protein